MLPATAEAKLGEAPFRNTVEIRTKASGRSIAHSNAREMVCRERERAVSIEWRTAGSGRRERQSAKDGRARFQGRMQRIGGGLKGYEH